MLPDEIITLIVAIITIIMIVIEIYKYIDKRRIENARKQNKNQTMSMRKVGK